MQISEGKPEYDPTKSQMIANNDFSQEDKLNFTPYQQPQIGVTKHSASLAQSNPLYAKAQEQRDVKPSEPSLSLSNVKQVWGKTAQPVEETKVADPKEDEHYSGSNNITAKTNSK